eukprot:scaffold4025_cov101-Isochrysis_galbana.AAC.3
MLCLRAGCEQENVDAVTACGARQGDLRQGPEWGEARGGWLGGGSKGRPTKIPNSVWYWLPAGERGGPTGKEAILGGMWPAWSTFRAGIFRAMPIGCAYSGRSPVELGKVRTQPAHAEIPGVKGGAGIPGVKGGAGIGRWRQRRRRRRGCGAGGLVSRGVRLDVLRPRAV